MSAIGPGDIVLCVEADHIGPVSIEVGQTYEIEEAFAVSDLDHSNCTLHGDACPKIAITLLGVHARCGFWCVSCFVRAGRKGDFDAMIMKRTLEDA